MSHYSYQFFPKKSFGQNFLINEGVKHKIIDVCHLSKDDNVLEIGPGKGALTKLIVNRAKSLLVVEKDKLLARQLIEQFENITVVCDDFLKFSVDKINYPTKVIANLPYNVATPIIEKLIFHRNIFTDIFVMVQLEHGLRMVAKPKTKDYGSLSCFIQLFTEPKILFKISPGSFSPAPRVTSCFMHIKPLKKPRHEVADEELLFNLIRRSFLHRRKTLENALSDFISKEKFKNFLRKLELSDKVRAEELSLEKFVMLSCEIAKDQSITIPNL